MSRQRNNRPNVGSLEAFEYQRVYKPSKRFPQGRTVKNTIVCDPSQFTAKDIADLRAGKAGRFIAHHVGQQNHRSNGGGMTIAIIAAQTHEKYHDILHYSRACSTLSAADRADFARYLSGENGLRRAVADHVAQRQADDSSLAVRAQARAAARLREAPQGTSAADRMATVAKPGCYAKPGGIKFDRAARCTVGASKLPQLRSSMSCHWDSSARAMKLCGYGGNILAQLPCGSLGDGRAAAALSASACGGTTLSASVDHSNIEISTTGRLAGLDLENTMLDADIYLGSIMWGVDFYRGCKLVKSLTGYINPLDEELRLLRSDATYARVRAQFQGVFLQPCLEINPAATYSVVPPGWFCWGPDRIVFDPSVPATHLTYRLTMTDWAGNTFYSDEPESNATYQQLLRPYLPVLGSFKYSHNEHLRACPSLETVNNVARLMAVALGTKCPSLTGATDRFSEPVPAEQKAMLGITAKSSLECPTHSLEMLRELEGRIPNTPTAKTALLLQYAYLLGKLKAGSSEERAALAGIVRTIPLAAAAATQATKSEKARAGWAIAAALSAMGAERIDGATLKAVVAAAAALSAPVPAATFLTADDIHDWLVSAAFQLALQDGDFALIAELAFHQSENLRSLAPLEGGTAALKAIQAQVGKLAWQVGKRGVSVAAVAGAIAEKAGKMDAQMTDLGLLVQARALEIAGDQGGSQALSNYLAAIAIIGQLPGTSSLADAADNMAAGIYDKLGVFCLLKAQDINAVRAAELLAKACQRRDVGLALEAFDLLRVTHRVDVKEQAYKTIISLHPDEDSRHTWSTELHMATTTNWMTGGAWTPDLYQKFISRDTDEEMKILKAATK